MLANRMTDQEKDDAHEAEFGMPPDELSPYPCGCTPCPDCGAAGCTVSGCQNESHGMVINGF